MNFKLLFKVVAFAAPVMTISVGGHALLEQYNQATPEQQLEALLAAAQCFETVIVPNTTLTKKKTCPKPIELIEVKVEDGRIGDFAVVSTWFKRHRPDCPFVSWAPEIIGSDGIQRGTTSTLGNALTPPPPDGSDVLTDRYGIVIPDGTPEGPATYRATIDYACHDSVLAKEIVSYPSGITFCVLRRDGSRPETCAR